MEAQLAAYRARKAREQAQENSSKSSWFGLRSATQQPSTSQNKERLDDDVDAAAASGTSNRQSYPSASQNYTHFYLPAFITNSRFANYIRQDTSLLTNTLFLKIILWLALLVVFVIVEFAAVFIVLTLFYVMYTNMRSGRETKTPGELSAYSVFNPNCERIDGTLTAEQFEKELRHGIGST